MAEDTRILELMAVPPEDHDLSWLDVSLQTALSWNLPRSLPTFALSGH